MTLSEAHKKLQALPRPFCITAVTWDYRDGNAPSISWEIWDGKVNHVSTDLASAVDAALAANDPSHNRTASLDVALGLA